MNERDCASCNEPGPECRHQTGSPVRRHGHVLILFQWQCRAGFKISLAATAPGPYAEPDKRKQQLRLSTSPRTIVDIHALPACLAIGAEFLQICDECIHLGLAFNIATAADAICDLLVSVGIAEICEERAAWYGVTSFGVHDWFSSSHG